MRRMMILAFALTLAAQSAANPLHWCGKKVAHRDHEFSEATVRREDAQVEENAGHEHGLNEREDQ